VEGSGSPSVSFNDEEINNNNDSRHITSVLLWKMVGYTPSSFTDLVFAIERIKMGLKRGKFKIILLGRMRKLGQMKRLRMKEKPMLPFLHGKIPTSSTTSLLSQYQPFSLPTTQLSTKVIPESTTKPTYHTTNAKHHL